MANETCSMFEEKAQRLMTGIRVIGYKWVNENQEDKDEHVDQVERCQDKIGVSCRVCKVVAFDSVKAQSSPCSRPCPPRRWTVGVTSPRPNYKRDHFKLDWHRFNVKQRLMGKPSISEEDFEETISGELSSISGSDSSETESDDDDKEEDDLIMKGTVQALPENPLDDYDKDVKAKHERSHPKIFLCNNENCVFMVYRATVYSPKNIPDEEEALLNKLCNLAKESLWMILMTAGGHFAAAVFDGDSVVVHKTFHRYTVRAKRGSAQGVRDSQQGRQPKSAGASLRRYNESALVQDVHDLLEAWSEYLQKCHKIFIRVQTYNKPMFFCGKKPPLDKNDSRIRTIPFATRRPTFKEVQRVHNELAKVEIIGQETEVTSSIINQLSLSPKKKQQQTPLTDLEIDDVAPCKNTDENELDSSHDSLVDNEALENAIRNTSVSSKKSKKKKNSSRKDDSSGKEMCTITDEPNRDVASGYHVWNRLYCAVVSGNMKVITELLLSKEVEPGNQTRTSAQTAEDTESKQCQLEDTIQDLKLANTAGNPCTSVAESAKLNARETLSERWGEEGSTLLHIAAKSSLPTIINILMLNGANPSIKDDRGRTPYDLAKSKETRDQFRRFMADFPEAFDYTKSHIPSPLTKEMKDEKERKEAEKKKAQRKARKQRIKEQKATEQRKQEEEEERKKSEMMSEREKRALAAERRFAKQQLQKNGVSSRSCAMCSQDLTGRVPFERLEFKYCSTACVRQHRLILENKGR